MSPSIGGTGEVNKRFDDLLNARRRVRRDDSSDDLIVLIRGIELN